MKRSAERAGPRPRDDRRRDGHTGQSLVEFAIVIPVFMLMLLGMLEFGLAFTHHQQLAYATREGARAGAALANGGGKLGCGNGQSPNANTVDPQIVAAVERVLTADGSPIKNNLARVPSIRIFLATSSGAEAGPVDVWTYKKGAGPTVDGKALDYVVKSTGWAACGRTYNPPAQALGVSLQYTYELQTGLSAIFGFFGGGGGTTMAMSDKTIMNINPTNLNFVP